MKGLKFVSAALATAGLLVPSVYAVDSSTIDTLVIKGKHFFYSSNGTEFFIRGVAYQQNYNGNGTGNSNFIDPLASLKSCQRDIPYLAELRTNAIRTYALSTSVNHKPCMDAFAAAGIYIIADLSAPSDSINRDNPEWNDLLYQRYITLIDEMQQYNNVLGFFAGNEVINTPNTTASAAFVKAAVRDSKAYIKQQGYRKIGVGYASYDGNIRNQIADYFNCGPQDDAIDFFGYNVYSWCGYSSYIASGYNVRTQFFAPYSVPVFFAEYGCNQGNFPPNQRPFTEVGALYGSKMTGVWAGGVVYQYFQTTNNFGLVDINSKGQFVSKLPDFTSLSAQMAKISPSSTNMANYNPGNLSPASCPPEGSAASWLATATPLPPTPNAQLCSCLYDQLQCVVKKSTPSTKYANLFGTVCHLQKSACAGFQANGTTGQYNAYSVCSDEQKLSYAINFYYLSHGSTQQSCSFGGNGVIKKASSLSGTCKSLLSQAGGIRGTGTVAQPTGNSNQQASFVGSSAGAGATSTSSKGAAAGTPVPSLDFGLLRLGAYIAGAVLTGAGIFLI